jgi:8-oxo-dGTP pyrophosphatase MutT (NUDIX family)
MGQKEKISIFIPYKIADGEVLVYLQKREKNAKTLPDFFGFFGGHAEGRETAEETLIREIQEEMSFLPAGYKFFDEYEFADSIKTFFTLKIDDDFENKIKINEGEYGKFFNKDEALNELKMIEEDKIVLRDFYKKLLK